MEAFVAQLATSDTKKKLSVGQSLLESLQAESLSVEDEAHLGPLVDGLVVWIQSSNFKVVQFGLDIVAELAQCAGSRFRPYLGRVLGPTLDRLGDARESVREKARRNLQIYMTRVTEPQTLFEKLQDGFAHKNAKVREELLALVSDTLQTHGAPSLALAKLMPAIVSLVSDSSAPVRESAVLTLVEIYRCIGDRVRLDLTKKYPLPANKLAMLFARFDQVPNPHPPSQPAESRRGEASPTTYHNQEPSKSRSSSVPAGARKVFAVPKTPNIAGAVDEESFLKAFEDVKKVNIFSGKALTEELQKIKEILSKSSNDWKIRVNALQAVRSLLIAGAGSYDEMQNGIRMLDVPFQVSIKDLRSQVVREACITVAYMCQQFGHKLDKMIEYLLQNMINIIPNSAKVMSTSGIVCIRFIFNNTYSSRFLPIITGNIASKSREIRRHCCEFLDQILSSWPTSSLEKHCLNIQEAIKKGISDADPEARQFSRKAYWGFARHFSENADQLLHALDAPYRRILQAGEMSNSSSSNSVNLTGKPAPSGVSRSRQGSFFNSRESIPDHDSRRNSLKTRKSSGVPQYPSPSKPNASEVHYSGRTSVSPKPMTSRSNSAIDSSAVRRANVRAQYAQRNRIGATSGMMTTGSRRSSTDKGNQGSWLGSPDCHQGRTRTRIGVVHSQPGSRSTSPSSLRLYQTFQDSPKPFSHTLDRKRSYGVPKFSLNSRDNSPTRTDYGQKPQPFNHRTSYSSQGVKAASGKSPCPRSWESPENPVIINEWNTPCQNEFTPTFGLTSDGSEDAWPVSSKVNRLPIHEKNSDGKIPRANKSRHLVDPKTDAENVNPDEIHKTLRYTANAIQNYSFDCDNSTPRAKLDDQNRVPLNMMTCTSPSLEEKMQLLDMNGKNSSHAEEKVNRYPDSPTDLQGQEAEDFQDVIYHLQCSKSTVVTNADKRSAMTHLIRIIREDHIKPVKENFRSILRSLLENLSDDVGATRALVYGVLTEMLNHRDLSVQFQVFTELIILKVLEAHRDQEKDVERAAESCASAMASVLPADTVIRVLNPIIKTGDFPVNQAAIKMLSKVADQKDSWESFQNNLGDTMPGLLKAYDNVESSVRKAAVFCMVSLHQLVGDDLQPFLNSLNGSKLKLLNLYIKRSQSQRGESLSSSPN